MKYLKVALYISLTIGFVIAGCLIAYSKRRAHNEPIGTKITDLDFPFYIVDEQRRDGPASLNKARLLVSPQDYSKENIGRIFQWYSQKYPEPKRYLVILLFTSLPHSLQDKEDEENGHGFIKGIEPHRPRMINENRMSLEDAFYCRGLNVRDDTISELYTYSPDLSKLNDLLTVELR